jgi:hypothetical protein
MIGMSNWQIIQFVLYSLFVMLPRELWIRFTDWLWGDEDGSL